MYNYDRFKEYLATKECYYVEDETTDSYMLKIFNKVNDEIPVEMSIYFDKQNQGKISIYLWDLVKVNDEKLQDYYELVNTINCNYRYLKLYIEEDKSLSSSYDYSCGEEKLDCDEFFDIICALFGILDKVMPDIMKLRWA